MQITDAKENQKNIPREINPKLKFILHQVK